MDPAWTLIAALVALYFVEGLVWVRRASVAFSGRRRRGHLVRPGGPFGNASSVLLPLPLRAPLFVVEGWPLVPAADAIWPTPLQTLGGEAPGDVEPFAKAGLRVEGKALVGRGGRVVTSSAALAHALRERVQNTKRAAAVVRAAAKHTHDLAAVEARLDAFSTATRWLRPLCALAGPALLGAAYGLFFVPAVTHQWRAVLAGLGALLALVWTLAYSAHRRLYPALTGDRWLKTALLVFSPPAAARADQWLARDALATFHPLAVAAVVLDDEAFEAYAGEIWRDLHHPLGPTPKGLAEPLAEARAALAVAHRRVLTARGLDPDALLAPPARPDDGAVAFCPRCRAPYRAPAEALDTCADCPGVRLSTWEGSAITADRAS